MSLLTVMTPESTSALTMAVGWALVWFLGQGVLVGLVIGAALWVCRARSAKLRYAVACAGLFMMALCPLGTAVEILAQQRPETANRPAGPEPGHGVLSPQRPMPAAVPTVEPVAHIMANTPPAGRLSIVASDAAIARPSRSWRERVETAMPFIVAAWLVGASAMVLRLGVGLIEIRGLTRREVLPPAGELMAVIDRLMERSGVRRPVNWLMSLRVEVPTVVGWLRPTVLIPAGSLAKLTLRQVEALLAHELAHIRRFDYLVNLFQVSAEAALFFHPAVWWVSRQIRVEREHCCDDAAAAHCDGDRLLVARALFALEEHRRGPVLGVAASGNGGSLKTRVRRLVSPTPPEMTPGPGWAGGVLLAGIVGLIAAGWLAGSTRAGDEPAPKPTEPTVLGRVLDEAGRPAAGARVRLYRRDSRWERVNPVVEETTADTDGRFTMRTPLKAARLSESRGLPPFALVADLPGKAVGWKVIPNDKPTFEGDLTLTPPIGRTINVVDEQGRPMSRAKVEVQSLGDPSSALAYFQDTLSLRPDDGPMTAITGADGKATFRQLPKTNASFIASKPGYAATNAFRLQDTIRLTPSATLSGRVTGPEGQPLAGMKVRLYTTFMWSFEHTMTDAQGRYRFDDLRARGWDMSAWTPKKEADGKYKIWLEDERFVMPTGSLTLEPRANQTLNIQAIPAGVIQVQLIERGTKKPVANARIWGYDQETGSSSRFNAYTDAQGQATFYSAPSKIWLSLVGPPEGVYVNGSLHNDPDTRQSFDFPGGAAEVLLIMPPIAGRLVGAAGTCTLPDGSPAVDATVNVSPGAFVSSGAMSSVRRRGTDSAGHFTLSSVPAGRPVHLYAESADHRFAGVATAPISEKEDLNASILVRLKPTVNVERVLTAADGLPLRSTELRVWPIVDKGEFISLQRTIKTDREGRVKLEAIVPGLSYRIQEQRTGMVAVGPDGPFTETVVLVPDETRKPTR